SGPPRRQGRAGRRGSPAQARRQGLGGAAALRRRHEQTGRDGAAEVSRGNENGPALIDQRDQVRFIIACTNQLDVDRVVGRATRAYWSGSLRRRAYSTQSRQ